MGFITKALGLDNEYHANLANVPDFDYTQSLNKSIADTQNNGPQDYNSLIQALTGQMQGTGPSVAQNQLNQSTAQNIEQAAALAGSQKGVDPALAARMAVDSAARSNQMAAGDAATLRAREQLASSDSLANALTQKTNATNNTLATLGSLSNSQTANKINNQNSAQSINSGVAQGNQSLAGQVAGKVFGAGASLAASGASGGGGEKMGPGFKDGGVVPGDAEVSGDSPENDTVNAKLSPGEIVLPRSVAQSPEAAKKAMEFVEAIKRSHKPTDKVEYRHVMAWMGGVQ